MGATLVSKFTPLRVTYLIALPAVAGVKATTAVVEAPLTVLLRVMVAAVRTPGVIAANVTVARLSRAAAVLKVDIVMVPADCVVAEFWSPATVHDTATPVVPAAAGV